MLENKQKELKGTIQSLLQSRDTFVNAYEVRVCVPISRACLCVYLYCVERDYHAILLMLFNSMVNF